MGTEKEELEMLSKESDENDSEEETPIELVSDLNQKI